MMKRLPILIISLFWAGMLTAQINPGVFYVLRSSRHNMAISNKGALQNAAPLYQVKEVGKDGQWEFIRKGDYYQIRNRASRQYIANFSQKQSGSILKQTNGPRDGALWKATRLKNGDYQFKNKLSGLYLAHSLLMKEGQPIVQTETSAKVSYWRLYQVREEKVPEGKLAAVLRKIETAKTLQEVRTILAASNLTEKEFAKLNQKLQTPKYEKLLAKFRKEENELQKETERKIEAERIASLKKRQQHLDKAYQKKLSSRNEKARQMAQNFRADFSLKEQLEKSKTLPQPEINLTITPPTESSSARIDRVSPSNLIPGTEMSIRGTGFGEEQGQIHIWIEEQMFDADINQWSGGYVGFDVPREIMGMLMGSPLTARIRILLSGNVLGPFLDLEVIPNGALLQPQVHSISSSTISPGQEVTIIGENFSSINTSIVLNLESLCQLDHERVPDPDNRYREELPEWEDRTRHQFSIEIIGETIGMPGQTDQAIHGRLFDQIAGFGPGVAEILITNIHGKTTTYPVRFEPRMFAIRWERGFTVENHHHWMRIGALGGPSPRLSGTESVRTHPNTSYTEEHRDIIRSSTSSLYKYVRNPNEPMEWWEAPESFSITDLWVEKDV